MITEPMVYGMPLRIFQELAAEIDREEARLEKAKQSALKAEAKAIKARAYVQKLKRL